MSNPARYLYRIALQGIEERPIKQQIEIMECIASLTNDPNESDALEQHAADLRAALARTTQLALTFKQ